jgi:hypothetical protein
VLAGVEAIPTPATLRLADLNEAGGASASWTIAATLGSGTAVFRMQGEEESRVPEPGATSMLVAGCIALALLDRRRWRARHGRSARDLSPGERRSPAVLGRRA